MVRRLAYQVRLCVLPRIDEVDLSVQARVIAEPAFQGLAERGELGQPYAFIAFPQPGPVDQLAEVPSAAARVSPGAVQRLRNPLPSKGRGPGG